MTLVKVLSWVFHNSLDFITILYEKSDLEEVFTFFFC